MSGRKEDKTGRNDLSIKHLFAETHRGILFDIIIFLVSLSLMRVLTSNFVTLVGAADHDDEIAQVAVFLFCVGIFVLPPIAAILKRYHFHHRLEEQGQKFSDLKHPFLFGCLFNPLFYFCLNIVIVSALNAFIQQLVYGKKEPGAALFVSLVFIGLGFSILQTWLVYRFFKPPARDPKWEFLKSHRSALVGDLCILLNMVLYQVVWNALWGSMGFGRVDGVEDFFGRLFLICFLSLMIYFPPRILYLAEDIRRPAAWFTILLANSPLIFRVLLGTN